MPKRYIAFRIDEEYYQLIKAISAATGWNISQVLRFMIRIAVTLLDPDVKLRDLLKERYIKDLEGGNIAVLDMALIDILKPEIQVNHTQLLGG